jgi:hypothetical protein
MQWCPYAPAMVARLMDQVWTLRDVLLFRVPPRPQSQVLEEPDEHDPRVALRGPGMSP